MAVAESTLEAVKKYYGEVLKNSGDLKTNACACSAALPPEHKRIIQEIAPEIQEKFYGCGSPIPEALEGCTVLDLGCGTGRDAYLASRLVGTGGYVIGVDMTEGQLEVARRHRDDQMRRFGYEAPNVDFRHGYIEDLRTAGIDDNSVDVVISNCVINLSPQKDRAFAEIFRVLRPGGEMYIADVFADRRLPAAWMEDPELLGECLAGALYTEDFRRLMARIGCPDVRTVAAPPITIDNPVIADRVGTARFTSHTVRAFKVDGLEDRCEDYGHVAYYQGTAPGRPHSFQLDDHHIFETGRPAPVCGNTALMLTRTRFAPYFRVEGDWSIHYGLFGCAPAAAGQETAASACC